MKNSKYRLDIIPGTVIFIFSIWYLLNIPGIPTFTGLGATPLTNHFVPYLWGGAMLVLSLWLIVRGMKKRKAYKAEGGEVNGVTGASQKAKGADADAADAATGATIKVELTDSVSAK